MRAGGVWNLTGQSDIPEARDTAVEQACNCPSGRLVVRDRNTGIPIEPELERSIAVIENPLHGEHGPLWVRGGYRSSLLTEGYTRSGTGSPYAGAGDRTTSRSATGVMSSIKRSCLQVL